MRRITIMMALALTTVIAAKSQTKSFIDQPYIEVSGSADTLITPNEIYIKILISERDSKDKLSVEEQESKMIAALKKININTELNLTTSDILSNYKSYLLKQKDIIKSKEYILKVADAATASNVFIELEDLGISNSSVDKVANSDLDRFKNYTRTRAIENAKAKAIELTKPLMQSVGNAIHITDNEANFENQFLGRLAGISIRGTNSIPQPKYEAPKIEFEKIKVLSTVSVKFILK